MHAIAHFLFDLLPAQCPINPLWIGPVAAFLVPLAFVCLAVKGGRS